VGSDSAPSARTHRAGWHARAAPCSTRWQKNFWQLLREKHDKRLDDVKIKPLASYRAEELKKMHENFYGADPAYHIARQKFVYKGRPPRGLEKPAKNILSACG
jgi:hypothetical protein